MAASEAPILSQSVRWGENYVSRALNVKSAGIIPAGIYHGYEVKPCGEMAVLIEHSDDYPRSVAVVERDAYSLTVIMEDPGIVKLPAPGTWHICIEALYSPHKQGYQRIVARESIEPHHIVLATVHVPTGEAAITSEMIDYTTRQFNAPAREIVEKFNERAIQDAIFIIRLSDQATKESLRRIELENDFLSARALARADRELILKRECGVGEIITRALDRIARLELAFFNGVSAMPYGAGGASMSPSGYTLYNGAKVAPVSIVQPGGAVPLGAAFTLKLESMEMPD